MSEAFYPNCLRNYPNCLRNYPNCLRKPLYINDKWFKVRMRQKCSLSAILHITKLKCRKHILIFDTSFLNPGKIRSNIIKSFYILHLTKLTQGIL